MTGENYASIFLQAIAMRGSYCNHLTGVPRHPQFVDFEAMPVFLLADERCSQIVVWGLDNVPQGHPEWVDEEVNYGIFPFYCLGDGKDRKSPVYYLMNIADAIKQFFQHTKVPKPEVHTVLLTNSDMENADDVRREWEYFNVHVVVRQHADDWGVNLPAVIPHDGKMDAVFTALCQYLHSSDEVQWLYDRAVNGLLKDSELTGMANKWKRGRAANSVQRPTKQQLAEEKEARKYAGLTVFEDDAFMRWCNAIREPVDDEKKDMQDDAAVDPFWNELSDIRHDDFEEHLQKLLFDDEDEDEIHADDSAEEREDDENEEEEGEAEDIDKDDDNDEAVYCLDLVVPDELGVEVQNPYKHPDRIVEKLIGMHDLRDFISQLSALTAFQKRVQAVHPSSRGLQVSLHSLFVGPVGTGKTTAARLMGSFFRQAGVLSIGHLVVANPQAFVGKLFGTEEEKVEHLIELARGGVLFIDEAYLFAAAHPHDPLRKVLPMMLNVLGDETNRDIAIILAGYEAEMENLMTLNPGLRSRFPNRFTFQNFTLDELLEMALLKARRDGFTFTDEAWQQLCALIAADYNPKDKEWGNGRYITNLLDHTYRHHGLRCIREAVPDDRLLRITAEDIKPLPSTKPAPTRTIGFLASSSLSA